MLSLSPTGKLLLSATPSLEFRVWNSGGDWSNEKWTDLIGRLKTAAWSPDGATLLFATEADCVIYAIDFKANWETKNRSGKKADGIETAGEARPVLDVSGDLRTDQLADTPSLSWMHLNNVFLKRR